MSEGEGVATTPAGGESAVAIVEYSSPAGEAAEVVSEEIADEQEPLVETPVPVEEKPKQERVSAKLAELRAREAAAEARAQEAEAKLAEAQALSSKLEALKKTPSKVLQELGISFNDLAEAMLSEGEPEEGPSELDELKATVEELKAKEREKEELLRRHEDERQKAQLDAAIGGIKTLIDSHIDANPDNYDLIRVTESKDLVYEIMLESYKQTGTVIHFTEACDAAENFLTERAKKLATSKKVQEFVAPSKPAKTSFGKTLTSQVTQMAAAASSGKDPAKMTHEERLQHAARVLRFN
jgi:hypothetical protein